MNTNKYENFMRRRVAFFSLVAFICQLFAPIGVAVAEAGGIESLNVVAPAKADVVLDDADVELAKARKANVLFLLDTSTTMMFSPKGLQPSVVVRTDMKLGETNKDAADWPETHKKYNYGTDGPSARQAVIKMMKYATYGSGSLPPASSAKTSGKSNAETRGYLTNMYGREVDDENNFKLKGNLKDTIDGNRNNYYFPLYEKLFKEPLSPDKDPLDSLYGFTYLYGSSVPTTIERLFTVETDFKDKHKAAAAKNYAIGEYDYTDAIYDYSDAPKNQPLPYAMVFKNPKYWVNPPSSWTSADLVPNDSRMYQMKLAMWRLLGDSSNFENIRFAMATPYAGNNGAFHTMTVTAYKTYPYGGGPATGISILKDYEHGGTSHTITGQPHAYRIRDGQQSIMWGNDLAQATYPILSGDQHVYKTVNRAYLRVPFAEYDKQWNKRQQGTISHADKLRMWIDGVEDIRSPGTNSDGYFYNYFNPELKVTGIMPLAMCIYPNPDNPALTHKAYMDNQYIWYSIVPNADGTTSRRRVFSIPKPDLPATTLLHDTGLAFSSGSGESVGFVRDFFSPPLDYKGTFSSAVWGYDDVYSLDPISFPVQDECEDNWVVIITSGSEVSADSAAAYKAEDAIANLYHSTNYAGRLDPRHSNKHPKVDYEPLNKVKELYTDAQWKSSSIGKRIKALEPVNPNKPIRTLVIGFVTSPDKAPDKSTRDNIEFMHKSLHRMARAGQSGNPDETPENKDIKATIVDNPLDLYKALEKAFRLINSELEQPEKGTMAEGGTIDDADGNKDGNFNLYAAGYRVVNSNQWQGALRRYASVKDPETGFTTVKVKGELNEELLKNRSRDIERTIKYWSGGSFIPLTETDASKIDGDFAKWTGLDGVNLGAGVPWVPGDLGSITYTPAWAFYKWLQGYDFSYENASKGLSSKEYLFPRDYMLADLGQSGVVIAGPHSVVDSLPGYREWAYKRQNNEDIKTRLYAQTNDGILHIVDPKVDSEGRGMKEEVAILLPPVLLPTRLAATKLYRDNLSRWIDVTEPDDPEEISPDVRSRPLYLLDGPLQIRPFDLSNGAEIKDWQSLMIAPLGRAGNGIYAMNVSKPKEPQFMWYYETVVDKSTGDNATLSSIALPLGAKSLAVNTGDTAQSVTWSGITDVPATEGYRQLGFNSPKPALGVVGKIDYTNPTHNLQNIIILPGGMKSDLQKASNAGLELNNGTEGAALFVIDPADGSILRIFNSYSLDSTSHGIASTNPKMGMMISEPTLYRSTASRYITSKAFAADNLGRIFAVDFADGDEQDSSDGASKWKISLAASLQESNSDTDVGNYANPYGVALGWESAKNQLWLAGGTADVGTRNNDTNNRAMLVNKNHMIFSFGYDKDKVQYRGKGNNNPLTDDWKKLKWDVKSDDDGYMLDLANEEYTGWYILLEDAKPGVYGAEYVSAKPLIVDNTLYVATYIDKVMSLEKGKCGERNMDGIARLYVLDVTSGAAARWSTSTPKAQVFNGIKITGLTLSTQGGRRSVMATFDVLNDTGKEAFDDKKDILPIKGMNNADMPLEMLPGASMKSAESVINYWLEK